MAAPGWELSDRRVLAALTFVDAIGRPVRSPVRVSGTAVRLMAKRPGEMIVLDAPGLSAHTTVFEAPPAMPAVGSSAVALDVVPADPGLGARRVTLLLPRDPNPANAGNANSLFRPIEITLLPAPSATSSGLVTAIRVSVTRDDDGRAIEGALVRLRPEGGRPQAVALTDPGGEALVLVPGVPLASPGMGGVVLADIAAELDAIVDPLLARFHAPEDVAAARAAALARDTGLIDPDDLELRLSADATPAIPLRIGAGRTHTAVLTWAPP